MPEQAGDTTLEPTASPLPPAPDAEALETCAPLRDHVRPARSSGQRVTQALELPPTDDAHLLAAVVVLLACHARRRSITLHWQRADTLRAATFEAAPDLPFRTLLERARLALAQPAQAVRAPAGVPHAGVLIDLGDATTPPLADWVLRRHPSTLDADADLYRPDSLPPLARQLRHLVTTTGPELQTAIGDLELVDATERERVLRGFNHLRLPVPAHHTLVSLIVAEAQRQPDAICAVHGERQLSFGQLEAASSHLAARLVAAGVAPGRFVAVVDRRGIEFLVAMVAIWKAGGAYVPIDPGYPEERVRHMLLDSDAAVAFFGPEAWARFHAMLADGHALRDVFCLRPLPGGPTAQGVRLHDESSWPDCQGEGFEPRARPRDPAYMIYTSGSTGRPKGAIVRHDGAVNHLFAQAHALGRDTVARFLQSAPSSSDISVWQFAGPPAFGGTTVIIDDATDVARVITEVRQHGLHLIELVPAVLKYLIEYAAALPEAQRRLPSLRHAMVTGESASVALVNAWLALFPDIPIVNAYGPTEAADDITQAVIDAPLPARQVTVSIGRPLANLDLHVLDERLRPLPVGAPGEICVAGIGVGDGYWRRPDKTRESFVANPFADHPHAAGPVLYRTGDIGRWRDDGTLDCAGRIDHQVQLRGQRIELAEIESVLCEHPSVASAVVQAFHDGQGDGRLVAFVVPREPCDALEAAWRSHLAGRLPPGMLPAAYVRLDALPLNPAGKVDRQALKPPAAAPRAESPLLIPPVSAPRTEAQAVLARLWAEELGVPGVGIDDDFFALGGDSMTALAIAVGAREAGWDLRSADVLNHPTVQRLARVMRPVVAATAETGPAAAGVIRPLTGAEREAFLAQNPAWSDVQALTPAQQGIFVHWLMARDKRTYIDQLCYEIDGELDVQTLADAWQAVVDRHAALRAGFLRSALPQPVQVTARAAPLPITVVDLQALDAEARERAWIARCSDEVDAGFDLARPPLMRLLVARLDARRHALAWTHHHLLLDGWSVGLIVHEVRACHDAAVARVAPTLPAPVDDAPYREHLAHFDVGPGLSYWRQALQACHPAPAWRFAPPGTAARGHDHHDLDLTARHTSALAGVAAGLGVTLGTVLQAAWSVVLARHTGQPDTVFGLVSSGRDLPVARIESMVGLFVVTQPLRVPAAPGLPLGAWLSDVQQRAIQGRAHEAVPLSQVVRAAALPVGQPLFDTLFVMWNFPTPPMQDQDSPSWRATQYRTVPAYPLSLILVPGERLQLRLVWDRQRFGEAAAASLTASLLQAVEALAAGQDPRALLT